MRRLASKDQPVQGRGLVRENRSRRLSITTRVASGLRARKSNNDLPSLSKEMTPTLTPQDIVKVLEGRGWEATIVEESSMSDMVPVKPSGILKCVDGRGSDNTQMQGPKMPGGIYAIAHNRGTTSLSGLKAIAMEVANAGHVPSVHGDHSSDMLGCGFFKLWVTGRFDSMGYARPEYDADQGANAVRSMGGTIEMHHGSHNEKEVLINLVQNKTLEPREGEQRFIVDGWAAGKFGLDVPKFLVSAAATVEMLGGPKKARIIVPSPTRMLTPEDIASVLEKRGWKINIVEECSASDLVPVKPTGILKCVDGRGSDNTKMQGPKLPGGVYAIAHNRGTTSLAGLKAITKEVAKAGHVPSVHGDHSSDMLGCGFFKLWVTGRFDDMGYPRPEFDANQGAEAVWSAGGVIEMHHGFHNEKEVVINLVENKTLEPSEGNQRFIVDGWAAHKFGLDVPKFLLGAAATVEMLGGPKVARIIIPSPVPLLRPLDIASFLTRRGWDAEIVEESSLSGMVPVKPTGILKCGDGRCSDNIQMQGPKLPGGIYAIAHNRGTISLDGLKAITKEVSNAGHVPSVHGDHWSDMLGCGFFKLWLTGRFDDMGYPRPEFDADQGAEAVRSAGGMVEMHHGTRGEKEVLINLVKNKTLEPSEGNQRFVVDGWAAAKFGLDLPKFLLAVAVTFEMLGSPKKARIIIPSPVPVLRPQDIASVLVGRGWEAEIVSASSLSGMVPVKSTGILKCVDGRGSDNTQMQGPKMPGGIYSIAHNRGTTSLAGLKAITKEVANAGHIPSVHGDHSSDMLGCGFFKLWVTGRFDDMGYPRPKFDADQGAAAVKSVGGIVEMHHGSHAERVVLINLVDNMTLEPDENDQRFIVDGWAAQKFGLDVPKFLVAAAATVEMLGGPKKATIIVS